MTQGKSANISVSDLDRFCLDVLGRCGMSESDARTTADVLVTTDTFGVHTHGVKCLKGYVRRLLAGGLDAKASPEVRSEGPSWAVVDGHSAIGMVTSVFAMNLAIEKARTTGMAYVGVQNSCHFGAAGYYALLAAKAGMVGMAMANDIPSMAAPGSRKAVLGTNPFAYAVPAGRCDPIFLDIASSSVAGGKVYIAQALGQEIPDNWLVDAEGLPTTDPFQYPHASSLVPFAGHKGYGIAMMIETLSGILSGAAMTWGINNWIASEPSLATKHGAAFLAFNADAIVPDGAFRDRVDQLIAEVHAAPTAKGVDRIYVPGEIEWQKRKKALAEGMALPDDVMANHRSLAEQLEMSVDWLRIK